MSLNTSLNTSLNLNEEQLDACKNLESFINSDKGNFLLLGCAGSGKTTTLVNTFNNTKLKVAFCAFTNKATQVLKNISSKFNINFDATFLTIHKLLNLEIKYSDTNNKDLNIYFKFDLSKVSSLKEYDIIIFDECSTISKELYTYIVQTYNYIIIHKDIKFIFVGDYWQLPPVGEEESIIFTTASADQWHISKLSKVMRSANDKILNVNHSLISFIDKFKTGSPDIRTFVNKYPRNIVSDSDFYISNITDLYNEYVENWKEQKVESIIILTYSKSNCDKINFAIKDILNNDPDDIMQLIDKYNKPIFIIKKFKVGERCCMDRPIDLFTIIKDGEYHKYDTCTDNKLYNGEIFDVIEVEDAKIKTKLNIINVTDEYFDGQIITLKKVGMPQQYKVFHISSDIIDKARSSIYKNIKRHSYIDMMSEFIRIFPKLDYGYCMTIYKSQGSEWEKVFINLSSIRYSIIKDTYTIKDKIALFKATYTAMSRASHELRLFSY